MIPGGEIIANQQFTTPRKRNPWNNDGGAVTLNTMTDDRVSQVSVKFTADYIA